MHAIGKIQAKVTKQCTICSSSYKQTISVKITENTDEQKNAAKAEISTRAKKPYTCSICKSFVKDVARDNGVLAQSIYDEFIGVQS